jgi:hypothetical protein
MYSNSEITLERNIITEDGAPPDPSRVPHTSVINSVPFFSEFPLPYVPKHIDEKQMSDESPLRSSQHVLLHASTAAQNKQQCHQQTSKNMIAFSDRKVSNRMRSPSHWKSRVREINTKKNTAFLDKRIHHRRPAARRHPTKSIY